MLNFKIVIPYRDNPDAIIKCLESIPQDISVFVVDDCSASVPLFEAFTNVTYLRLEKRGYFAGAVNAGIVAAQSNVLILNQDVILIGEWRDRVEKLSKDYDMFGDGVMNHPAWPNGYVQGTFMFVSKKMTDAIGMLDEKNWPLWGGTCEFQLRACRSGFKVKPFLNDGIFEHSRIGSYGSAIEAELKQNAQKRGLLIRTPPLVSVVAPCFNHGKYASELWASLLAQTFQGFDLTIVDDASTDDTWSLLQELSPDFTQVSKNELVDAWRGIRLLRMQKNSGTPSALNAGIKKARGRFILTIDGDDMLAPNAIERFLVELEKDDSVLAYSDATLWRNGLQFDYWKFKPYDFNELVNKNYISSCVMFSRKSWEKVGGYDERFRFGRQDWAWAVKLGLNGICGVWINEPLLRYRREGQNRVVRNSTYEWNEFFRNQMHEAFPQAYDVRRRPMACCGGRRTVAKPAAVASVAKTAFPLEQDAPSTMVMLEYIGTNDGRQTYYGRETGIRYVVGAGRKYLYVDKRDAELMTKMLVGHKRIFKTYEAPPQPEPVIEVKDNETEEPQVINELEPVALVEAVEQPKLTKRKARRDEPSN